MRSRGIIRGIIPTRHYANGYATRHAQGWQRVESGTDSMIPVSDPLKKNPPVYPPGIRLKNIRGYF